MLNKYIEKSYCDCCDSGNKKICKNKIKDDNKLKFIHWEKERKGYERYNCVDCIYKGNDNIFYYIEFKNYNKFKQFYDEKERKKFCKKYEDTNINFNKNNYKGSRQL